MHKMNAFTLLKCIVFSVVWTCCWGGKKRKARSLSFTWTSGWLVRCSCSGKRQKPSGGIEVLRWCYRKAIVRPAITMLTIDMSLMRMFSEGPEVSLNGSPTVSPTIVALWFSLPLPSK